MLIQSENVVHVSDSGYYVTFFMGSQGVNCARDLRDWRATCELWELSCTSSV